VKELLKSVYICQSYCKNKSGTLFEEQCIITRASLVMILNQRRWQSLGEQHGKGVDGLFEKVSFQTAFEGIESG